MIWFEVIGEPFSIASHALPTMMMTQVCELGPGDFVHTLGDAHLHSNPSTRITSASNGGPPSDDDLLAVVARSPDGVAVSDLEVAFRGRMGRRTLQRRLTALVDTARLSRRGSRRWTRYSIPAGPGRTPAGADAGVSLSVKSRAVLRQLDRPFAERPVASQRL